MKKRCIVILLILMLAGCVVPPKPDPFLDRGWIEGGKNEMSGWSVGFRWMGDPEEFRNDVISGGFTRKVNGEGTFSMKLPLDEFALNLLGDTEVKIYYNGVPQFWGYMDAQVTIDEGDDSVSITGGDMMSRMQLRKVDYLSVTSGGANPPRGDQTSKAIFENLIHWYTGDSATDSMFRNEFIEHSETSYRYSYDGNSLMEALIDVAQSCSLTIDGVKKVGYATWITGEGDILLQPYGWKKYGKEIASKWVITFDYEQIRNRVKLRGGIPDAWESIETTKQFYVYDATENQSNWILTLNSASGTLTTTLDCKVGDDALFLKDWSISTSNGPIYITRTPTAMNWTYLDEYGAVQNFLQGVRFEFGAFDDCAGNCGQGDFEFRFGSDSSNYIKISVTTNKTWGYGGETLDVWAKIQADEESTSWSESGTVDWSAIDWMRFMLTNTDVTFNYGGEKLILDALAFYFKEVDIARRDENSIKLHGLREAKFQDRRITDWPSAGDICQNILDLLKYPAINANTSIPYFDPTLELNMLVEPVIQDVRWPLYINELSVNWSGDHVTTDIKAGRPVPAEDDIIKSLKLLRDQDSEKGTGFKTASQYDITSCFKDEELFCRTDCQVANCQNSAQLLSCYTFVERDLCKTTCQRYKERIGWLDSLKDI